MNRLLSAFIGVAVAAASIVVAAGPAFAGTARPVLNSPSGQTEVKPGDKVTFSGEVDPLVNVESARIRVYDADTALIDFFSTDRVTVDSGTIGGDVTLPSLPATTHDVDLELVVSSEGQAGTWPVDSNNLVVDMISPVIQAVATDPSGVKISFSEAVSSPSSDSVNDWTIDGTHPTAISGSDDQRILHPAVPLAEDATPTVRYVPRFPVSQAYRDGAGNELGAVNRTATALDGVAPTVTIDTRPTSPTKESTATYEFSSTAPDLASFTCTLTGRGRDGDPATVGTETDGGCVSPKTYSGLAPGGFTFTVSATDTAGNASSEVSHAFVVDNALPSVIIEEGPVAISNAKKAAFGFHAEKDGALISATFECALTKPGGSTDRGACTSRKAYGSDDPVTGTPLVEGNYSFVVTATDGAGNSASSTPLVFTIDRTAPEVTIDKAASSVGDGDVTGNNSATFVFTAGEPISRFECSLDAAAFEVCTPGISYSALTEGAHNFSVRATDRADNTGEATVVKFIVDPTSPVVDINDESVPNDRTNQDSVTLAFIVEDDNLDSVACRLATTAGAVVADGPCTSPTTYGSSGGIAGFGASGTPLAAGDYIFTVTATDKTAKKTSDLYTFTVDKIAPVTTVGPLADDRTNANEMTFTFGANEDATFSCTLTRIVEAVAVPVSDGACVSPATFGSAEEPLVEGDYSFAVTATDLATNQGDPAEETFTIDRTAPTVTIDEAPDDSTNQRDVSFEFSSPDADLDRFECVLATETTTVATDNDCVTPKRYTALGDGTYTFTVTAFDTAGNDAGALHGFVVDTGALSVPVGGPPAISNATIATLTFEALDNGAPTTATFECVLTNLDDNTSETDADCESPKAYGDDTPVIGEAITEGTYSFVVTATDDIGNEGTSTPFGFIIDRTAPNTTIDSGPAQGRSSSSRSPTFTFSSDDAKGPGSTFRCKLDGGDFSPCTSPQSFSDLAEGSHSFTVVATDAAGNVDASPAVRGFGIDVTGPETILESAPAAVGNSNTATFTFRSSEAGSTFECKLERGATVVHDLNSCSSTKTYTALTDGTYRFSVSAQDPTGNRDSTPALYSFTVDTVAPNTFITSGPSQGQMITTSSATFGFSSGETSSAFGCKMDSGAFESCNSGSKSYTGLSTGSHTFSVRASDPAGNVEATPATRTFTVTTSGGGGGGGGGGGSSPSPSPQPSVSTGPSGSPSPSPSPTEEVLGGIEARSTVSIRLAAEAKDFVGAVRSDHGECRARRTVTVYKARKGARDRSVGRDLTGRRGRWSIEASDVRRGRYYAIVKKRVFENRAGHEVVCLGSRSPTIRVRNSL
ncbi:MAG: Ig-like domain-containing protein [Actinomycetota bacterium]